MKNSVEQERIAAVQRFLRGEKPKSICAHLKKSRSWLYKWIDRFDANNDSWAKEQSRAPHFQASRIEPKIEEAVKIVRLSLYNKGLFCGDQAILWELDNLGVTPLPSLPTINRILERNCLTHRRTGRYESKGVPYPKLLTTAPNQVHQLDLVGPCYLIGGNIRFYGLNVIDIAINRCGIEPMPNKSANSVLSSVWAIWRRLGIPLAVQADNEMVFYGGPKHPRGMGVLIRLCLMYGVELWFNPVKEPWRNGVVEKFNDHYKQKFLSRVFIRTFEDLKKESLEYELRHNNCYRYGKLGGKTPQVAFEQAGAARILPDKTLPPKLPLTKPEDGRYHLVRFIRSDLRLNIFGEVFKAPPEVQYEYVVATIDVKEQKLKLFLNTIQVAEYVYKLR
jgi:putative transposase